jgi:hypothetical protein
LIAEEEARYALQMRLEEEIRLAAARETFEARLRVEEEARIAEEKRLAKSGAEFEERIEKEKAESSQISEEKGNSETLKEEDKQQRLDHDNCLEPEGKPDPKAQSDEGDASDEESDYSTRSLRALSEAMAQPGSKNKQGNNVTWSHDEEKGQNGKQTPYISPQGDDSSDNEDIKQSGAVSGEKEHDQVLISEGKEQNDESTSKRDTEQNKIMDFVKRTEIRHQSGDEESDAPWWLPDDEKEREESSTSRRTRAPVGRRSSRSFRSYSRAVDPDYDSEDEDDSSDEFSEMSQSDYSSKSGASDSSGFMRSILPR